MATREVGSGDARSIRPATLNRGGFRGWWDVLNEFTLTTAQSRALARQGVPAACAGTLKHVITGLEWRVVDEAGQQGEETDYYELLLDNARGLTGEVIGFTEFMEKGASDILTAREGWSYEIVRIPEGQYAGVPTQLVYMDAAELRPTGDPEQPVALELELYDDPILFGADEVGRARWEAYNKRGMEFYNVHPVLKAYVALAMLTSEDNYTYELLTQVVPQGLLNLGTAFTREKAAEWKQAWDAAKGAGGKLDDIGLLYGTEGAEFIRFGTPPKDMPFQHASYWYLTLVTANFEMSPFDLSYMTQINTKAGSEATVELSRNKGLKHLLRRIKDSIEQNVLPEGLFLDFPDLDPRDEQIEADVRLKNTQGLNAAVAGGWITRAEAREEAVRLEAYEVDPGAALPEPASPVDEEPTGEESEGEEGGGGVATALRLRLRNDIARTYAEEGHADHVHAQEPPSPEDWAFDLDPEVEEALDDLSEGVQELIAALFLGLLDVGITVMRAPVDATPSEVQAHYRGEAQRIVPDSAERELAHILDRDLEEALQAGIDYAMGNAIPMDFDSQDPEAVDFLLTHSEEVSSSVVGNLRARITKTLAAGDSLGEPTQELLSRVRGVIERMGNYRARMIAYTETSRLVNGGHWLYYKALGLPVEKVWVDGQAGACQFCEEEHGNRVGRDERFPVTGVFYPPAHPWCRCGMEFEIRRDR